MSKYQLSKPSAACAMAVPSAFTIRKQKAVPKSVAGVWTCQSMEVPDALPSSWSAVGKSKGGQRRTSHEEWPCKLLALYQI